MQWTVVHARDREGRRERELHAAGSVRAAAAGLVSLLHARAGQERREGGRRLGSRGQAPAWEAASSRSASQFDPTVWCPMADGGGPVWSG